MKFLLLSLALVSSFAFSDEGKFEDRKKEILEQLDKRASLLQEEKSCMSAAASHEDMKRCREKMKESHHALKEAGKARRDGHIDEKIKKLQDMKEKK